VPASAQRRLRAARASFAFLVSIVALLAATAASADNPASERHADRLRSANADIGAESRAVLLELYALESQLGRAEERLAALRAEAAAVDREREEAHRRLALVQKTLREAEERLGLRLRELYVEGDPDPLAVLLGAASLDDAITSLENLGRFATQDRGIIEQVREARAAVRSALEDLAAREDELRRLTADAEATRSALVQARAERSAYLAALVRQRRVNAARLAELVAQASVIESRSDDVNTGGESDGGESDGGESDGGASGGQSGGGESSGGGSAPPPVAVGGTRMTVQSTGYCLKGTTATGMPVGFGVVAVDPSVIPLGTRMTIPGYGEGVAADTGSAVRGAVIDLWFPSCAQAVAWGRRTVTITLH
jgi:peptidoglycan DL-endopeptidase CwlO